MSLKRNRNVTMKQKLQIIIDPLEKTFKRCGQPCHHPPSHAQCDLLRSIFRNPFLLVSFIIMMILLLLMLLGMIKGCIGICCSPKIGMMGLNILIDLPRPLAQYQEKEISHRPVIYDIAGYPVHPDTKQRTVRILSRQTEFCLNLIFFLSYPLALIIRTCAFLCCIKNYNNKRDTCFSSVNIIRLIDCEKFKKKGENNKKEKENPSCPCDVYKDEKEEKEDTEYVITMLKRSQESLRQCECEE